MNKIKETTQGILAMGLLIIWMSFLPFYGPGFYQLGKTNLTAPYTFVIFQVIGLIYGSWIYYRNPAHPFISRTNKAAPLIIAIVTIAVHFHAANSNDLILAVLFAIMGMLAGLLVSRWMAWFSSAVTVLKRGSIFGKTVGLTYVILPIIIALSVFPGTNFYGFLLSALAALAGGYYANQLPLPKGKNGLLHWLNLLPPLDLLLFAVISYSFISLLYDMIFIINIQQPIFELLIIIPYLFICLLLAKWSDSVGRFFFPIVALFLAGLGFLTYLIAKPDNVAYLFVDLLILSAMLCVHFYYWLSLVDRQSNHHAPFYLSIGVSFELIIFSVIYSIMPYVNTNVENKTTVVGVTGLVLVLAGFAITTYTLYISYMKHHTKQASKSTEIIHPVYNDFKEPALNSMLQFYNKSQGEVDTVLTYKFNLTARETEVAKLLFTGYTNEEIKEILYISMNTVKYHIRNIYNKIGVSKRNEAAEIVCSMLDLN